MTSKLTNAIQWHEGMLLQPHHFQQTDRRTEQLVAAFACLALSHPWGLINFSYDTAALVTGRLHIWQLEALMPDGTLIFFDQERDDVLSIAFASTNIEDPTQDTITLFLTLPAYRAGQANAGGDHPRFQSVESTQVSDDNTGEGSLSFASLKPNIFLYASDKPPLGHISLPLLKVRKTNNAYQLVDYIPPLLKVSPQSPLGQQCSAVALRIRQKAVFLTERLHTQTTALMSAEAETAAKALAIALLPFEAILGSGVVHPFTLYNQLILVAAQLMAVSLAQMPPPFSAYHHDDVEPSFREVIRFIDGLLGHIQEGYAVLVFNVVESRIFSLTLPSMMPIPVQGKRRLIVGAKAKPGMSDQELQTWISQALIATQDHVTSCRDRRILGATRHFIAGDEELRLMPARDVILFAIDQDPAFITPGEDLHIFNVGDSAVRRPFEIVLYLPKENRS